MERELIEKFKDLKEDKARLTKELAEVNKDLTRTTAKLVKLLQEEEKEATAKYEGLGYISMMEPKIRASFLKENEEKVFEYVKQIGRGDIIKTSIHNALLCSFVKGQLEDNLPPPEIITYYEEPQLRFNKSRS